MNEATQNLATELGIEIVPAKVCVQIGKRKRYFDTVDEAKAALEKFNNKGTAAGGTGIMAQRKAAKALKEERLAGLLAYTTQEGVSDKSAKQNANFLLTVCEDKPEVYTILTGAAWPLPTEGADQGEVEIVDPEANGEAVVEEVAGDSAADPLADLLG